MPYLINAPVVVMHYGRIDSPMQQLMHQLMHRFSDASVMHFVSLF